MTMTRPEDGLRGAELAGWRRPNEYSCLGNIHVGKIVIAK
jgi:hypothetical protein